MRAYWLLAVLLSGACDGRDVWGHLAPTQESDLKCDSSLKCKGSPDRPLCDRALGKCVPCDQLSSGDKDAECHVLSDSLNACATSGTSKGRCVQCVANAQCGVAASPICDTTMNTCGPCASDDQCKPGLCKVANSSLVGPNNEGMGECVAAAGIAYVDPASTNCPGTGNSDTPYCDIKLAASSDKTYVVVRSAKDFSTDDLAGAKVAKIFIGLGRDVTPGTVFKNGTGLSVSNNANFTFDGFVFNGVNLACNSGGALILRRTIVRQNASQQGVVADGCGQLTIDRSRITNNQKDGVSIVTAISSYRIINSLFDNNGGFGVSIQARPGQGTGEFQFNDIVDNLPAGKPGGIDCGSAAGTIPISNSIIFRNAAIASSQFSNSSKCVFTNVVVGTAEKTVTGGTVVNADPVFVVGSLDMLDFKLSNCCVDRLDNGPGFPTVDYFDTMRPQSVKWDIGFHEAKKQ